MANNGEKVKIDAKTAKTLLTDGQGALSPSLQEVIDRARKRAGVSLEEVFAVIRHEMLEASSPNTRLRAAEMLGKTYGAFMTRNVSEKSQVLPEQVQEDAIKAAYAALQQEVAREHKG